MTRALRNLRTMIRWSLTQRLRSESHCSPVQADGTGPFRPTISPDHARPTASGTLRLPELRCAVPARSRGGGSQYPRAGNHVPILRSAVAGPGGALRPQILPCRPAEGLGAARPPPLVCDKAFCHTRFDPLPPRRGLATASPGFYNRGSFLTASDATAQSRAY